MANDTGTKDPRAAAPDQNGGPVTPSYTQEQSDALFDKLFTSPLPSPEEIKTRLADLSRDGEIQSVDFTTDRGQFIMAMLALGMADGAFMSAAGEHSELRQEEEKRKKNAREIFYALLLQNSQQELEKRISDLKAQIAQLDIDHEKLQTQRTQTVAAIDDLLAKIADNNRQIGELDQQINAARGEIFAQIGVLVGQFPEMKPTYDAMMAGGSKLVIINASMAPGGPVQPLIVYGNEETGYYVKDDKGNRVELKDLTKPSPDSPDFIDAIKFQKSQNKTTGDNADPALIEGFERAKRELATFIQNNPKYAPLGMAITKQIAQIENLEVQKYKLLQDNEDLARKLAEKRAELSTIDGSIAANRGRKADLERELKEAEDKLKANQAELDRIKQQSQDLQRTTSDVARGAQRYDAMYERQREQNRQSGLYKTPEELELATQQQMSQVLGEVGSKNFQSSFDQFASGKITYDQMISKQGSKPLQTVLKSEPIKQKFDTVKRKDQDAQLAGGTAAVVKDIAQSQGTVDRHALIRKLYTQDMGWLDKELSKRPNWFVNGAAALSYALSPWNQDKAIVQAWNNHIKTSDGQSVYRDANGVFYTLDEKTQKRTPIVDSRELQRINIKYADGVLVANETPFGKDKENTFTKTNERLLRTSDMITQVNQQAQKAKADSTAAKQDAVIAVKDAITGKTPISSQGHPDAGKLSTAFNVNREVAADRVGLDKLSHAALEDKIRHDPVIASALKAAGVDIEKFMDNKAMVKAFADTLELRMKKEGLDFSKQIAELRELEESMGGTRSATIVPKAPTGLGAGASN
jgi:septal ring factor EnvC (AmiA/AmiB activator)